MAKHSMQPTRPTRPTRAPASPPRRGTLGAFDQFAVPAVRGVALPEEADLYTIGTVDRRTGKVVTAEAQSAAGRRMRADITDPRQQAERGERDERDFQELAGTGGPGAPRGRFRQPATEADLDALGEGDEGDEGGVEQEAHTQDHENLEAEIEAEVERRLLERRASGTPVKSANAENQRSASPAPGINVRLVTLEDIDRLWDWIRADGDNGAAFFSRPLANSIELHQMMLAYTTSEQQYANALIRAIYYEKGDGTLGDQHLGFAALAPILSTERVAVMHIYLRADVRGALAKLTPPLVNLAQQLLPAFKLAVLSTDATFARLHRQVLGPLGFTEHVLFVR